MITLKIITVSISKFVFHLWISIFLMSALALIRENTIVETNPSSAGVIEKLLQHALYCTNDRTYAMSAFYKNVE